MTEEEIKKIRETLNALLPNKTWAVLFWEENKPGGYIHSTDCTIKEVYIRLIHVFKDMIQMYSVDPDLTNRVLVLLYYLEITMRAVEEYVKRTVQ